MQDFVRGLGFFSTGPIAVSAYSLPLGQYRVYVYGWGGQFQWYSGISSNRQGLFNVYDSSAGTTTLHTLNYTDVWPGQQVPNQTYFTFDLNVTQPNAGFSIDLLGQGSELLPLPTVCNGIQIVPIPAPAAPALFGIGSLVATRRRR